MSTVSLPSDDPNALAFRRWKREKTIGNGQDIRRKRWRGERGKEWGREGKGRKTRNNGTRNML